MPLRIYKCPDCGDVKETLKKKVPTCNKGKAPILMEEVIKAPSQKFMVSANKAKGTSKPKDLKSALTERARNHTRDTLIDDNIQLNKDNELGVANNLLNDKMERRRKIDDI